MSGRRIPIGISSCLVGERVRYDGDHRRDRYITDVLSEYFQFVPVCPEVAIGLGVPRATIRLRATRGGVRAIQPDAGGRDVTAALAAYGSRIGRTETRLCGYILKSRSPSCGIIGVTVYDREDSPSGSAPGIYTAALKETQPLLPTEEEGRLHDPDLRDNFFERVFVYHCWQRLAAKKITARSLARFHDQHRFLIPAHSESAARELGRMIANLMGNAPNAPSPRPLPEGEGGRKRRESDRQSVGIAAAYLRRIMQALARPAKREKQVNALQLLGGQLKDKLSEGGRRELAAAIEGYRNERLPIIVPLMLLGKIRRGHTLKVARASA